MQHWPTLWQQFGLRPLDVGDLTVHEVVLIEKSLEHWEQQARIERATTRRR